MKFEKKTIVKFIDKVGELKLPAIISILKRIWIWKSLYLNLLLINPTKDIETVTLLTLKLFTDQKNYFRNNVFLSAAVGNMSFYITIIAYMHSDVGFNFVRPFSWSLSEKFRLTSNIFSRKYIKLAAWANLLATRNSLPFADLSNSVGNNLPWPLS